MNSFSERLGNLREEKRLSQTALGAELNIPRTTISSWEQGMRTPELKMILVLSNYFSVSIDYLIGKTDIKNPEVTEATFNNISSLANDNELADFISKLSNRIELQTLCRQVGDLSEVSISKLIKVIDILKIDEDIKL
jgi:transcriptional regulator with XRE-family HTH domain